MSFNGFFLKGDLYNSHPNIMLDRQRRFVQFLRCMFIVTMNIQLLLLPVWGMSNSENYVEQELTKQPLVQEYQWHVTKNRTVRAVTGKHYYARIRFAFKNYEGCMRTVLNLTHELFHNIVLTKVTLEGRDIELSCLHCVRPDQNQESFEVRWFHRPVSGTMMRRVKIDANKWILMPDKALLIKKANIGDGGLYKCFLRRNYKVTYMLDVISGESFQPVVPDTEKGRQAAKPFKAPRKNLEAVTTWSAWSKCSLCNKRGVKRRIGFCTIRKLNMSKTVRPEEIEWLQKSKEGLPCRSSLLPPSLKELEWIKHRSSESMIKYCFSPCPTPPPIKVFTDANGVIIETVDVGKGFYSMKDGLPSIAPLIKRQVIYAKQRDHLKMECPNEEGLEAVVVWQNGSQTLNAMYIRRETRGRVAINAEQNLVILRLRMGDTAVYSCWVDGNNVAAFKVKVVKGFNRNFKDYIMFAGLGAIILLLLYICISIMRLQGNRSLR